MTSRASGSEYLRDLSFDMSETSEMDPCCIKSREDRMIEISNAITALSRQNSLDMYDFEVMMNENDRCRKKQNQRRINIRKRQQRLQELKSEMETAQEKKSEAESQQKLTIREIQNLKKSINTVFTRIEQCLPSREDSGSATTEDEEFDEDTAATNQQTEKFKVLQDIKKITENILHTKLSLARCKLEETITKAENGNIKRQQKELNDILDHYKERLTKADDRSNAITETIKEAIGQSDFEESVVVAAEREADALELQLNKNRVEFFTIEAAREYQMFKDLQEKNKERTRGLKQRRKRLQHNKRKRERSFEQASSPPTSPSRQGLYLSPPSSRNSRLVLLGSMYDGASRATKSRKSKSERAQMKIDLKNLETDELIEANLIVRKQSEEEWAGKMEVVTGLMDKVNEIELLRVQVANAAHNVEKARIKEEILSTRLNRMHEEQDRVYQSCDAIASDMGNVEKNEIIQKRLLQMDKVVNKLERKKTKLVDMKKKLTRIEASIKSLEEQGDSTDDIIRQLNEQLEQVVEEIEKETHSLNSMNVKPVE